jgi:hypothetical protein
MYAGEGLRMRGAQRRYGDDLVIERTDRRKQSLIDNKPLWKFYLVSSLHKVVPNGYLYFMTFPFISHAFRDSSTNAARSRKALNSSICLRIPPESLLLLTWSATRLRSTSVPAISAPSVSEDFPKSIASSISCTVVLSVSLS